MLIALTVRSWKNSRSGFFSRFSWKQFQDYFSRFWHNNLEKILKKITIIPQTDACVEWGSYLCFHSCGEPRLRPSQQASQIYSISTLSWLAGDSSSHSSLIADVKCKTGFSKRQIKVTKPKTFSKVTKQIFQKVTKQFVLFRHFYLFLVSLTYFGINS